MAGNTQLDPPARADAEIPGARVMRFIYSALLYLLVPVVVLRLLWLGRRNPAYLGRWRERFGLPAPLPADRPIIWLHAVSVGEVHASGPLVQRLLNRYPRCRMIVTTTTPTGAAAVRQTFGDQVSHLYFPYDLPRAIRSYFDRVHPSLILVMETELWPNFVAEGRRRGVPIALINARMPERAVAAYTRTATLARATVRNFALIASQTDADRERYLRLGADPRQVVTCGNLKFDIHLPHSVQEQGLALRQFFSVNRPIWICASTHDGEEQTILNAFSRVRESYPACLLIIAPRHPERSRAVEDMCRRAGFSVVCRSREEEYDTRTAVMVLDTLGELASFYACSDVAFVGGSLVPAGGHNLLEPACLGVPVLCGPHLTNFQEIFSLLREAGAAEIVEDPESLAQGIVRLLADGNLRHAVGERGRSVVERNRGAVDRIMDVVVPLVRM